MYDVVVVGAGITGLSCAWRLHRAGRSVLLLERADRVGGVIRSRELPGIGFIDQGPQTVRSGDPELFDEFRELGIEADRVVAGGAGHHRFVVTDGRLVPLPSGPGTFLGSSILPFSGKLRLLGEPLARARPARDETVDEFFRHRLGRHAVERLVDPFVSGVYAGDPRELSMRAVFPSLKEGVDRYGSLLRWGLSRARTARKSRKDGTAPPRRTAELFSFRRGLGQWPRALAAELGARRVRTGVEIDQLRRTGSGWRLTGAAGDETFRVEGRELVLAVPAPAAASLLAPLFPAEVRPLRDIPYAPVATVHLVHRREDVAHPLDGFGYLCPSREGRPVLGVLWISSLFPDRVAEGRVLTTTFIGGAREPERALVADEELVEAASMEHRRFLGASAPPVEACVVRHRQAIPQYELGHLDRVEAAARIEGRASGLHLAGAFRGGVSVPDCWKGGRAVADRILARIEAGRSATPAPASAVLAD